MKPTVHLVPPFRPAPLLNRVRNLTAPWIILLVLLATVAVEVQGFRASNLFSQDIWTPQGQDRLIQFAAIFFAAAVAVLILVPWLFSRAVTVLLVLLTAILLPKAILAVAFFLLSSWCLGSLTGKRDPAVSTLLGMAIYLTLMPFVVRLPINYPTVYFLILLIPIALRRPRLRIPEFSALPTWTERASFAILAFIFTIHWFAMLKPEAGADGLAMHLAVPMNIAHHHVLTYQPDRFVWAVMPMGFDFTAAIVYLLGGEHAARLLNLVLLVLILALLHTVIREWVSPATAWALLALFAATPMVELVTGELLSENLLAALLLGSLLAVWRRWWFCAAVLAGAAISTKLGALPFVGLLLCAAMICKVTERPRKRSAAIALALLIATAAPPYAIAWAKTGNPVFPFLREKFPSLLLPANAYIQDERFRQPFTWQMPYDLTFRTSRYYEGQHGSFGFQYLVLAPLAIAALLVTRRRTAVTAAIIALGASVIVLRSDPNARYLYPELPLLTVPLAALLGWAAAHHRLLSRALLTFVVAATMLNIWFLPASSYYHKDLYGPFTDAQREADLGEVAPIRRVISWFNRAHPNTAVLLTQDSEIVGLQGEVYANHWHQYNIWDRIRRTPDVAAMRRLLEEWHVRYMIARKPRANDVLRPQALRDLIANCTIPEFSFDAYFVTRLEPTCGTPAVPDRPAHPEMIAAPGNYDDFDPIILYRGDWERRTDFEEPSSHTVSFSDVPGSEASFAFNGGQLTWIFTKAPNRGIAAVSIDGSPKGTFDLHSTETQWRSRLTFNIGAGKHLLVIRVTGEQRPAARGAFVDIDAFEVR